MNFKEFGKVRKSNRMLSLEEIINNYKRKRLKPSQKHGHKTNLVGPQPVSGPRSQGPMPPPSINTQSSKSLTQLSVNFSSIPCTHEAIIRGHNDHVGALDVDKFASRLATGSDDYTVRLWDFYGMNKTMNSFKIVEPNVQQ